MGLLAEEPEPLDAYGPPVDLLRVEPLVEEPAAVPGDEVMGEAGRLNGGLDGWFDIGLGCK